MCAVSDKPSHSRAPFAGYTPTYKFFLGGGYFYKPQTFDLDIEGVLTLVDAYQLQLEPVLKLNDSLNLIGMHVSKRGFDPYYGEGSSTAIGSRQDIFGDQFEIEIKNESKLSQHLTMGLQFDTRIRIEDSVKESPGIRIGLPPDYIEIARIDVGFASDQLGVFIDFSHAF